jgi:predicted house-cleaning NTP pyrophosphatase (Maf/HAM1 superfamily)
MTTLNKQAGTSAERPPLVLASQSPRRRELLRYLGLEYEAIATTGEEEDSEVPAAVVSGAAPDPAGMA